MNFHFHFLSFFWEPVTIYNFSVQQACDAQGELCPAADVALVRIGVLPERSTTALYH